MNKAIKLFGLLFVMFTCMVFMDGVKAVSDGDGSGYARCYYDWTEEMIITDSTYTDNVVRPYSIGITAYKTKNGYYAGWAVVGCGENASLGYKTKELNDSGLCNLDNYDDKFHHMDYNISYFKDNGNWKCPSSIYLRKGDIYQTSMKIYFSKSICDAAETGFCSREVPLADSDVRQDGQPDDNMSVKSRGTDKIGTNNFSGVPEVSEGSKDEQDNKLSGDELSKIKKWGESETYDLSDLGNDCNVISGDIRDFLNNLLWILSIIGIILLVVMTAFEFVKVVTGQDDEGIKKAFKHTIIRIVCVVILLLLPMIVSSVITIINKNAGGTVQIGDNGSPTCQVGE